jgi:hypothetical protein
MKRFASVLAVPAVVAVLAGGAGVAASPAAAEACSLPQHPGLTFTSLTANDVPCHEANELALHVVRKGSGPAVWNCTSTISGRYVSWACLDRLIVSRQVYFTYYVQ